MRDKKFVAKQRGGTLTSLQHRQLVAWVCACVRHLLPLASEQIAPKMIDWLQMGEQWVGGLASTGDARNASMEAVRLARTLKDPLDVALVRASGHAVATAHMADHSLCSVSYLQKALRLKGLTTEKEKEWQYNLADEGIKAILLSAF